MTVLRFKGDHLEDDYGRIIKIPFEDLEEACLKNSYVTLSITDIVIEAVTSITGLPCLKVNCRESSLFNYLEESIRLDERYIQRKEEVQQWREDVKRAKNKEGTIDMMGYIVDAQQRVQKKKNQRRSY